ncbi:MAG: PSD1 and planctomycete cytochrome C domain-containing protein [Candidatus Hydrogenedentales bacterium]
MIVGLLSAIGGMLAVFSAGVSAEPMTDEERERFERDVRPILAANCFECHGPKKQESGMRLDHIEFILTGGSRGPAIDLERPEQSRILEAISYTNPALQMPPPGQLTEEARAVLFEWIAEGAPWPDEPLPEGGAVPFNLMARKAQHWAWQPITDPDPPGVKNPNWVRDPADQFILAKLESAGLAPAPAADKRTLIRRLYFDLIGLPPEPHVVEAFVADDAPDAYERLVDELLASPHYGERWGRHWLDLVRYAETYGHEQDYPIRHAWRYRDYVIRALNEDVPYDELVTEHVAGDLLENPRMNPVHGFNESLIGTGWWFMHQATHAPVDVRRDYSDRIDNQIDVFSKAFLGMTVACARCHDHKFDAISAEDYYALFGFLESSRQDFAFLDRHNLLTNAVNELSAANERGASAFREGVAALSPADTRIDDYLLGAHDVMHGEWRSGDDVTLLKPDIPLQSFEEGYGSWRIEGDAFGTEPATGAFENQPRLEGFDGERVVNSQRNGDETTGVLTSPPFLIERKYIRFLIGGGNHPGETCVNLLVDGEVARTAPGKDREALEPVYWDVAEFGGKAGQIQIVDSHTGRWGHVNADHIVFTEFGSELRRKRSAASVAAERGLDPDRLESWTSAVETADTAAHPLYGWRELSGTIANGNDFEARRASLAEEKPGDEFEVHETFDDNGASWHASGFAFTAGDESPGVWLASDGARPAPAGAAHSGLIDHKLQGVLRSPNFTITHDSIHFRVAGEGGRIRLVVEGYELREFNGILFDATLFDVDTGGRWIWHNMTRDLYKWKGRSAYIEIIDEGDGWVAIDEIRFSNGAPGRTSTVPFVQKVLAPPIASLDETAAVLAAATEDALGRWHEGAATGADTEWLTSLFTQQCLVTPEGQRSAVAAAIEEKAGVTAEMPAPVRALAITEGTPLDQHVFVRGEPNNLGEIAPRRFLAAIAGEEQPAIGDDSSGRLALARRLLDPANPLPARVMANRVWHYLFGQGIVASVDNFGVLGRTPSHPELLDHLAVRFRENGWSIKELIRALVLTETYRMSSAINDPAAEEADPENILLHRANVQRLESEIIRDTILAVAGTLDPAMYGDPVPIYLTPFMSYHRRSFESGPMDGDRRRTIYIEVRRNFLSPMQLAFDYPLPESTIGSRTISNVPAQALALMNDPFVVEQANTWGERVTASGLDTDSRIDQMYLRAFARYPDAEETMRVYAFLDTQAQGYELPPKEYGDLRLWSDLAHVLFTLKEFIFIQ